MADKKVQLGPGLISINGGPKYRVESVELTIHDAFDAPETPEEKADTARLIRGLHAYPFASVMRSGEEAKPLRYCNKCGYCGVDRIHQRPNGSGECGYLSRDLNN